MLMEMGKVTFWHLTIVTYLVLLTNVQVIYLFIILFYNFVKYPLNIKYL